MPEARSYRYSIKHIGHSPVSMERTAKNGYGRNPGVPTRRVTEGPVNTFWKKFPLG